MWNFACERHVNFNVVLLKTLHVRGFGRSPKADNLVHLKPLGFSLIERATPRKQILKEPMRAFRAGRDRAPSAQIIERRGSSGELIADGFVTGEIVDRSEEAAMDIAVKRHAARRDWREHIAHQ